MDPLLPGAGNDPLVSTLTQHCPHLTHLAAAHCPLLTDTGLAALHTLDQVQYSITYKQSLVLLTSSVSVVKSHHKFMLASYMKQIAKFLALLHHNASFFNFCIII